MSLRNTQTYDNLLLLKDAGAVTASGAATVAGSPRVLDLGANARMQAKVIVDTSATDTADANETYRVSLQGCNAIGFGSGVVELGSVTVTGPGRSEVHFLNQVGDTLYQFARAYLTISGTTPSINCTAFIAKL